MVQAASRVRSSASVWRPKASSTSGELPQLGAAEHGLQAGGFGVDAALAAGAAEQQCRQLGLGQFRRLRRGVGAAARITLASGRRMPSRWSAKAVRIAG